MPTSYDRLSALEYIWQAASTAFRPVDAVTVKIQEPTLEASIIHLGAACHVHNRNNHIELATATTAELCHWGCGSSQTDMHFICSCSVEVCTVCTYSKVVYSTTGETVTAPLLDLTS
jgi:hypothetical protein